MMGAVSWISTPLTVFVVCGKGNDFTESGGFAPWRIERGGVLDEGLENPLLTSSKNKPVTSRQVAHHRVRAKTRGKMGKWTDGAPWTAARR